VVNGCYHGKRSLLLQENFDGNFVPAKIKTFLCLLFGEKCHHGNVSYKAEEENQRVVGPSIKVLSFLELSWERNEFN